MLTSIQQHNNELGSLWNLIIAHTYQSAIADETVDDFIHMKHVLWNNGNKAKILQYNLLSVINVNVR